MLPHVATPSAPTPAPVRIALDRFLASARAAGCTPEQVRAFARAGYVPSPRQLALHAAARACDVEDGPTEIGYGGARGGGKSHGVLAQIGIDDCQRAPGIKALILRRIGKAIRESIRDMLPKTFGGMAYEYAEWKSQISFPNGSRIVLGHFNTEKDVDAYLGLEYDIIAIEEATSLSDSKIKAVRMSNRTSRTDWRPRMYLTFNPGGVGHAYIKKRFVTPYQDRVEAGTRFIPATVDDNPHVDRGYRAKLDTLTGWMLRAWRYGDWDIAAGQFFTTFDRSVHVKRGMDEIPDGCRVWLALDYGFTHYTAVYLMAEDGDGNVHAVDEHAERRWLPERHSGAIEAMLERHNVDKARLAAFVAGTDVFSKDSEGATIAGKYAALGWKLTAANTDRINGAAEILTRLGDTSANLPPSLYVSQRCTRLADCLPSMEHDPNRPEDVLKVDTDEDGEGGDDYYDALRYGVMFAARKKTVIKVTARNPFYGGR